MEENNKPTYEQLEQGYIQVYNENQKLRQQLSNDTNGFVLQRINSLLNVIDRHDVLSKTTINLAEWHLKNILAKPKTND